MLGDAGANVLGAVWALSVVLTTAATTRTAVLVALVVLNLASELVSFSAVIDRTPPLRALDRLGRRPCPSPARPVLPWPRPGSLRPLDAPRPGIPPGGTASDTSTE